MINRRFAPKTKELIYFRSGSKSVQKEKSPTMFSCESFSKKNFIVVDKQTLRQVKDEQKEQSNLKQPKFAKPFQSYNTNRSINSHRPHVLSGRKEKLQNLRSSIESLQKIIQRSREMLNESSVLNSSKNTLSSSKNKIKSDSLDIKFNYSTKKMNTAKLSQIKEKKLNSSSETGYILSLNDTNQSYRENLLLQSTRKKQVHHKHKNQQSSNFKSKDIENSTQIRTNHQLNMTLEKLLNQSFQSTINGKTLSISIDSPSSTFTGQTPKWFKKNDSKNMQKIKQRNKAINLQNDSFSNHINSIDPSELSQYEKIVNHGTKIQNKNFKKKDDKNFAIQSPSFQSQSLDDKTFDQQQWNEVDTKQNIFIEDKDNLSQNEIENDDVIEDEQPFGLKEIQNFSTNTRRSYHGQMKLHDSYLKNINKNLSQSDEQRKLRQKPKRLILRTPKAYQNYQQNTSSRKNSINKSWIPKNFAEFESKVLKGKDSQNIFKQQSNQGKFSPRVIHLGKQNKKEPQVTQKGRSPEDKQKKKNFINNVWKYPFVQRYLKESDIFLIYEKLRRSKIPQNKWILFVIDQVHKKMKQSHQ